MVDYLEIMQHDAFRYGGGLNKPAAEIYWLLLQKPMSASELINASGRSRRTVYLALKRMSSLYDFRLNNLYALVIQLDHKWQVNPDADLDFIAILINTAGKGKKQVDQHRYERVLHRKSLKIGQYLENLNRKNQSAT